MLCANEDRESTKYLAIGSGYCVQELSRSETVLKGLQKTATLCGELYVELVALMDGTLRQEDISARLGERFDQSKVEQAISEMISRGYARYRPPPVYELGAALRFLDAITSEKKTIRDAPLIHYSADGVLEPSRSASPHRRRTDKG